MNEYSASDFTEPETFFQIGIDPVRIDILTSVSGLDFGQAWERRVVVDFAGIPAPVPSRQDLIAAKLASGRPQDHEDVAGSGRREPRTESQPETLPVG